LINQSYDVQSPRGHFVLQRLNAIFDPRIHHDIAAVTAHLCARGMCTPELVPTQHGELWTDGPFRLMTYIEGESVDALDDVARAESAGRLVGRWHAALSDFEQAFVAARVGVHDTTRHLDALRQALAEHAEHRLHAPVRLLSDELLRAADDALALLPRLPPRVAHGDLKISNILFDGDEALCLIDLDTVGPMELAHELGDAWRSWCNPNREDESDGRFDLALFEASWRGYASTMTAPPSETLRAALLHGVEVISLELAARFLADALRESYFGWSAERFASAGDHNLARARGQWALYHAACETRDARRAILR
jgi:Ser/Thr protein kinase RdoA (MazF antagonist)